MNFEKAVQIKEDVQHHIYEKERLGTRKLLLEAAMSNDENMVRLLLSTDIDRKQLVARPVVNDLRKYSGFISSWE